MGTEAANRILRTRVGLDKPKAAKKAKAEAEPEPEENLTEMTLEVPDTGAEAENPAE